MKWKTICLAYIFASLAGCKSFPITEPEITSGSNATTVVIYREPAFNSAAGSAYFGEGEKTYVALNNSEYTEIKFPIGSHIFHVTAQAGDPFRFGVELKSQTSTCIKVYANPANYAKTLIPILFHFTNIFKADVVPCPDDKFLKDYSKI